jgi:hypothetical protein
MPTAAAREQIEADVMREHDEHIRLYTPILQRIIVLVAVIIAVPVVLWTITAFVRAYIGPPQLPTFRPMAAVPAPPAAPNIQVAIQTANATTATDARSSLLEIKKPSDPAMGAAVGAAVAPAANAPALAPAPPPPIPAQIAAVPPPPFAAANPNSGASTSKMPATVAAPPGIAPASIAPASIGPAGIAPANISPANVAQPAAPAPAPASPSAPAMAWPSPTAFNPSSPPNDTVASAEQATVDDAGNPPAARALPGKIPLPPHRPKMVANIAPMTNVKLATAAMPVTGPTPSRVPLSRARPASAPEPAPVATSYPAYDPAALH